MANIDWRLKGEWVKNCSCDFGCPCDFLAPPSRGWCKGLLGMSVVQGHFGNVSLNGTKFFAVVDFPGPLHEGNGTCQLIINSRASPAQRDALLQIASGKHSAEGTLFNILPLIVSKMLEPIYAPIEFKFDLRGRRALVSVPGVLVTETEPIRNPVTGAEHRIHVTMPEGFEYRDTEVCSARVSSTGGIKFEVAQGHGSLSTVEQTPSGVAA